MSRLKSGNLPQPRNPFGYFSLWNERDSRLAARML
jgi:hypothetical protein